MSKLGLYTNSFPASQTGVSFPPRSQERSEETSSHQTTDHNGWFPLPLSFSAPSNSNYFKHMLQWAFCFSCLMQSSSLCLGQKMKLNEITLHQGYLLATINPAFVAGLGTSQNVSLLLVPLSVKNEKGKVATCSSWGRR